MPTVVFPIKDLERSDKGVVMKSWGKNTNKTWISYSTWINRSGTLRDGRFFTSTLQNRSINSLLKKSAISAFGFLVIFATLSSLLAVTGLARVNSYSASKNLNSYETNTILTCIVGEAADQGLVGMIAVAEAIRNRGTLSGVIGCSRKGFFMEQPDTVKKNAMFAWEQSRNSNLTNGATHWESTDFEVPYWANEDNKRAQVGKHVFYKVVSL